MQLTQSRRAFGLRLLAVCAGTLLSRTAPAQPNAAQLEGLLRRTLDAVRSGQPNYEDMEPMLADQVEQQLSAMRRRLSAMGPVRGARFQGLQTTPLGPAEYYRIAFENGNMSWMIGLSEARKIAVLWTPG